MDKFKFPEISAKRAVLIVVGIVIFYALYTFIATHTPRPFAVHHSAGESSLGSRGSAGTVGYANMQMDVAESDGSYSYENADEYAKLSVSPIVPPSDGGAPAGNAKIVRSASLTMVVASVDSAASAINDIRTRLGGQPGNAQFGEYEKGSRGGSMTIWVPSEKFDEAMSDIKKLALQVASEQVGVSDVSAQFVDLEARLKNLRATEAQYVEIMRRSGTISDVLSVTRELSSVRSQVEQLQGQLNYLSRQIALSSITITLTQDADPLGVRDEWRPLSVIKGAIGEAIADFTRFIDTLLILLVKLPVFLVQLAFWGLVLWGLYRAGVYVYGRVSSRFPPSVK